LWSWNVATDKISLDERAIDLLGVPRSEIVTFENLSGLLHPADLDKVRAAFSATREITGRYEIDFRILHESEVRWISARGTGGYSEAENLLIPAGCLGVLATFAG
jgi:PAS domain-containing protein